MSPYRTPPRDEPGNVGGEACPDADLMPVFAVFWLGSIARVVLGISRHDRSDSEGALAAIAVVLVPWLARDAIAWTLDRCFRKLR